MTMSNIKLTVEQVRAIKDLLKNGASCSQLAAIFKVSRMTINRIKAGKAWNTII